MIDIGIDDFDGRRVDVGSHVVSSTDSSGGEVNLREGTEQRSSNRKARVVRFEGVETEDSSSGTERSGPSQENEPASTSSFSLSKFSFPAPPEQNWTGTFGKSVPCLVSVYFI